MNTFHLMRSLCYLWPLLLLAATSATAASEPPAIAARFETLTRYLGSGGHAAERRVSWNFWRERERVYLFDSKAGRGETWHRFPSGEVEYQQVFERLRAVVSFNSGDLRALGRYPDWSERSRLLHPAILKRLQHEGNGAVLDREAERYRGEIDGVKLEVLWLPTEQLPALIRQVHRDSEVTIRLVALHAREASPWPLPSQKDFRQLDFSDLGDDEWDPLVTRLHFLVEGGVGHFH